MKYSVKALRLSSHIEGMRVAKRVECSVVTAHYLRLRLALQVRLVLWDPIGQRDLCRKYPRHRESKQSGSQYPGLVIREVPSVVKVQLKVGVHESTGRRRRTAACNHPVYNLKNAGLFLWGRGRR